MPLAEPKPPEDPDPQSVMDIEEATAGDATVVDFDEWKQRRVG